MNTNPIEPCAVCGEPVDWSAGPHEFVRADGSAVVVCKDCCDIIAENAHDDEKGAHLVRTPGDDDATAGKSPTWPSGEPQGVRDMERRLNLARRADDLAAELDREFGDVRDEGIADAVRETIEAFRELSSAGHKADEEMIWRTAVHAHAALVRCSDLVAEIEQRTR